MSSESIHARKMIYVAYIKRLHICEPCHSYGFLTEYICHAITLVFLFPHSLSQHDQIANEMMKGLTQSWTRLLHSCRTGVVLTD